METNKIHVLETIDRLRPSLKPPVSNSMLFNEQLKVMIVGGPNKRKDFHIEMGEELFYQLHGDMCLVITDPSTQRPKDIVIKEGEVFLLPAGIAHSPQRFANTIGMVFERVRAAHESDCLLWYQDDHSVLYEEFLHCQDLGSQIKEAIERFNKHLMDGRPFEPSSSVDQSVQALRDRMAASANLLPLTQPFNLSNYLADHTDSAVTTIFDSEFVLRAYRGCSRHSISCPWKDVYLWQHTGSAAIHRGTDVMHLSVGEAVLLHCDPGSPTIEVVCSEEEAVLLLVANRMS
jgi:3-hydroxyanthranilate 3,4-dioxygenase